jgi:hypothetical protein
LTCRSWKLRRGFENCGQRIDCGAGRDATRRTLLNVIGGRRKTRRHRATK